MKTVADIALAIIVVLAIIGLIPTLAHLRLWHYRRSGK